MLKVLGKEASFMSFVAISPVGRRHAVGHKRARAAEGGRNRKKRLRADGCLERAELVP
jgi:hypothetical protein